jgi:serine/threonine protein kinase
MTPASSSQQHFTPPQGHFGGHHHHHSSSQRNHGTPSTPDTNMQPTFPPPAVTSESPPPSEQSQRRPAYLLHRDLVIGKGSYGQVCIASRGEAEGHTTSGRSGKRKKFACKCVMLRNDPKYISKLQEEVNVLRELRGHDNVIRLYDVFCVDNELFIITELGRGGDLFHLLTTHPKHGVTEAYAGKHTYAHMVPIVSLCVFAAFPSLTPSLFLLLFAAKTVSEMLSAVAFLHSRSICHRDLKLENWVLESGKDVWSPLKLIDFGLSTHFRSGERLTRVVGSSYYVAPEVLKKSYTEACDLWSLGVIVYMLLSGAPPFYGKNDEAIKASIVQGEYTFPHELFRDVSDEAMAFVSTLLSYNIEYRYTAAQALTHPWLSSNCDPDALQRAKDGARGVGIIMDSNRPEPMQL